jgi:rubrerythrin
MTEKHAGLMNLLCAAIEFENKEKAFYEKIIRTCPSKLGKEVFQMLLGEEADHEKGIREIYESMKSGKAWPESCSLFDRELMDARAAFKKAVEKHGSEVQRELDFTKALQIGIDFERESVNFYEKKLKEAGGPFEKKFLERMIKEEKGHHLLLLDMQYYFEDPEGYFMEKEHRGLDGA